MLSLSAEKYRSVIKGAAWYDLLTAGAFATPWTLAWLRDALAWVAVQAHLGGSLPPFEPMHALIANMFGSLVVLWALARLASPRREFGRADAAARGLYALWQIVALMAGASSIVWGFVVMEIALGALLALPVRPDPQASAARAEDRDRKS